VRYRANEMGPFQWSTICFTMYSLSRESWATRVTLCAGVVLATVRQEVDVAAVEDVAPGSEVMTGVFIGGGVILISLGVAFFGILAVIELSSQRVTIVLEEG
jgi:hypothetical protein